MIRVLQEGELIMKGVEEKHRRKLMRFFRDRIAPVAKNSVNLLQWNSVLSYYANNRGFGY